MKHIKLYEEYSDDEIKSLVGDLRGVGLELTEEEKEMKKFINQFGGGMDAEGYAEYLYDYYNNPEEYDIDEDGDSYAMICDLYGDISDFARFNLSGPMRMGNYNRWYTDKIEETPSYQLYLRMSK